MYLLKYIFFNKLNGKSRTILSKDISVLKQDWVRKILKSTKAKWYADKSHPRLMTTKRNGWVRSARAPLCTKLQSLYRELALNGTSWRCWEGGGATWVTSWVQLLSITWIVLAIRRYISTFILQIPIKINRLIERSISLTNFKSR